MCIHTFKQSICKVINYISRVQSLQHCVDVIKSSPTLNAQRIGNCNYKTWLCHGLSFSNNESFNEFVNHLPIYDKLEKNKTYTNQEIEAFVKIE